LILIDTSAWVEFLRGTGSPVCELVDKLLAEDIATCDPVRMEVLAGARSEQHLQQLRGLLARASVVPTEPADFEGQRIGVWDFGNEYEVVAAARAEGLEPDRDYEKVIQQFDMSALLNREIDVAEAMIYNEYAQVLETVNPETGELYQPEDLNVIDYNEVGTAMLQDHIFARQSWLAGETNGISNEDIAVCFLRASFQGWQHCRDNLEECVEITLDQGTVLGEGHMTWMMNEVNALVWPSPDGVGIVDQALWDQTIEISLDYDILQEAPPESAIRTDLAERALEGLGGDTTGSGFTKAEVEVTPGGE
jgi:NitT/TauT family transport system substrate-binding protein